MKYIAQYRQESRCYNETLKGRLTLEGLRAYWRNFQILSKLPRLTVSALQLTALVLLDCGAEDIPI